MFNQIQYDKEYYLKNKDRISKQKIEAHKKYPWKKIFLAIKYRCNNPKCKDYKYYGGRGIKCLISEEQLETLWYRDKAFNMKKPSIDREDNNGNYEYGNCKIIEFELNRIKNRNKPILQFTKMGQLVKEWESATIAGRQLKINIGDIYSVTNNKKHSAGGFYWRKKEK